MVDDIIEIIKNRFASDNLCVCRAIYSDDMKLCSIVYNHSTYDDIRCGYISFEPNCLKYSFCLNIEDFNNGVSVSYTDLDVDILVGLFLCKVYYND